MRKLSCEDPAISKGDILTDFRAAGIDNDCHQQLSADFDNGQWHVTCLDCGAAWAVVDAETVQGEEYLDFELISLGDEFCFSGEYLPSGGE